MSPVTDPLGLPFPTANDPAAGDTQIQALAQAVADILGATKFDPGDIKLSGATQPPSGWLLCNGAELVRVQYQPLFDAIGETYGRGDGVLTFQIPDLRGRCVRVDPFNLGWVAGADTVALTAAQMPAHNHGVNDPGHSHPIWVNIADYGANRFVPTTDQAAWGNLSAAGGALYYAAGSGGRNVGTRELSHGHTATSSGVATGISTQNNGSGQAHSNLPATLTINAFIKT